MDHLDSESDFELPAVAPVHDGFSDDPSETFSEEHEGKPQVDDDDVESGSDTDGEDIADADGVQQTENDGQTDNKSNKKKRKRRAAVLAM